MNKSTTLAIFFASLGLFSLSAQAGGDAAAGKVTAEQKCQACHGIDGNSNNAQYPKLGGQHLDYLVRALKDYKSGARKNPIMSGFAAGLSEQDQKDVAAWYSEQSSDLGTPTLSRQVQ